jgi:microcompartment protein CcmL/EutN
MPASKPSGPALGVLEIDGLARGIVAADAAIKKAEVQILWAGPVTPGKYLLLLRGQVAETDEALAAGAAIADDRLVDRLFLPQAHDEVWQGLGPTRQLPMRAVGIVETLGAAGALRGLDAACKAADVEVASLQLARGIGGKGIFTLTGEQHALEAALDAAANALGSGLVERQLLPRPHPGLAATVLPTLE